MRSAIAARARQALQHARRLGPYFLIELLVPGGTLILLGMWIARQAAGRA